MFVSEPLSCKVKAGEGMTVMKFALYIGIKCKKKKNHWQIAVRKCRCWKIINYGGVNETLSVGLHHTNLPLITVL